MKGFLAAEVYYAPGWLLSRIGISGELLSRALLVFALLGAIKKGGMSQPVVGGFHRQRCLCRRHCCLCIRRGVRSQASTPVEFIPISRPDIIEFRFGICTSCCVIYRGLFTRRRRAMFEGESLVCMWLCGYAARHSWLELVSALSWITTGCYC